MKEAEGDSYTRILTELALNLHLVIDQVQRKLIYEYRPISYLILNEMRILLLRLVNALGNEVVAVRTVCTTLVEMEASKKLT